MMFLLLSLGLVVSGALETWKEVSDGGKMPFSGFDPVRNISNLGEFRGRRTHTPLSVKLPRSSVLFCVVGGMHSKAHITVSRNLEMK